MSLGALDGIRVLDLGHGVAGPFAARLLGDFGADVVKLEPPAGDRARREAPLLDRPGGSALFELLNWNKRSLVLDLADPAERPLLEALVRWADVVVTSLRPRRLRAWGVDPATLRACNPRAVVVAISNHGLDAPWAEHEASDLVLQATSGMMAISGAGEREPLKHGLRTAEWCAGLNAAYASVAAVIAARRTGAGVELDLSIRECLTSELVMNHAYHVFGGAVQGRPPASSDPLDGNPLPTAAGHVALQTSARQPAERLAELFDDPRLALARFGTPEGRIRHAEELAQILGEHLRAEPARGLFLRACESGLLSGLVQGAGELLDCPQLAQREAFVELEQETAEARPWKLPAVVARLSRTPTSVRRPAPGLGEHDAELRAELAAAAVGAHAAAPGGAPAPAPAGPAAPAAARGRTGSAAPTLPLSGVRVLDLSVIFAVPYMGALLADLGAEVIKVEAPARLDQTRTDWGGYFDNDPGEDPWNRSGTFQVVNRGKRSLSLDLATDSGRAALRALIAQSDVLLDNFTPRVLPKWGMTYASLQVDNPRLVMLSNTGYGSTGPWSAFKAQGTTLEATMGLMGVTGYPGGPPARAGQSAPDFYACWSGLLALLSALVERERSGMGQWIDLGMYQLGPVLIPEALLHRQANGSDPERIGARDRDAVLSGLFPTRDGRWLAVSVADDRRLRALRELLGEGAGTPADGAALADGDALAPADRDAAALRAWALARDAEEAVAALQARAIAAGFVHDAGDLLDDAGLHARGFYETPAPADRGGGAPKPLIGRPYRWSSDASAVRVAGPAPDFGEANPYVLEQLLALDDAAIAALYEQGVVADAPVTSRPARPMDFAALLAKGVLTRVNEPEAIA